MASALSTLKHCVCLVISFKKMYFILNDVCVSLCVCVQVQTHSKSVSCPGAWVTCSYKQRDSGSWEPNSNLCKNSIFLTMQPSPTPVSQHLVGEPPREVGMSPGTQRRGRNKGEPTNGSQVISRYTKQQSTQQRVCPLAESLDGCMPWTLWETQEQGSLC